MRSALKFSKKNELTALAQAHNTRSEDVQTFGSASNGTFALAIIHDTELTQHRREPVIQVLEELPYESTGELGL